MLNEALEKSVEYSLKIFFKNVGIKAAETLVVGFIVDGVRHVVNGLSGDEVNKSKNYC